MQADDGKGQGGSTGDGDESDEDDDDGDDGAGGAAMKGQSRLFFENQPVTMQQVKQWGATQLMNILDEQTERLAQTNDQIIDIFKATDKRMKLFGLPLDKQKELEKLDMGAIEEEEEEA